MTDETARLEAKRRWARGADEFLILAAIEDCQDCVRLGIETSRYCDEISEYRVELRRRQGIENKRRAAAARRRVAR